MDKRTRSTIPTTSIKPRPNPAPRAIDTAQGEEHRGFPRRELPLRFELRRGASESPSFTAVLACENLSMSGAFLLSTFFLPLGTELEIAFALEPGSAPVLARAEIVRHQQAPGKASGFGVHFVEFFGQTEVSLAMLFLDARLTAFAEAYLDSKRAREFTSERDRMADALAAWELAKVTTGEDPWNS